MSSVVIGSAHPCIGNQYGTVSTDSFLCIAQSLVVRIIYFI